MENDKYIFRDSEQTKSYLWDAYNGYVEHFNNYIMYERIGRVPMEIISGIYKYANMFYYQILNLYKEFPEIKNEDLERYKNILTIENITLEQYRFIMVFIENFMTHSGVKNIVFETDNPGESIKENR